MQQGTNEAAICDRLLTKRQVADKYGVHQKEVDRMVKAMMIAEPVPGWILSGRRWSEAEVAAHLKRYSGSRPRIEDLTLWKGENVAGVVYFLYQAEALVYIGMTEPALKLRIRDHRKSGKIFDRVHYLKTPLAFLRETERALIAYYKPPLNKSHVLESVDRHRESLAACGITIENDNA